MKIVYIVRGGYDYEGSSPIRGFANRESAERYANTIPTQRNDQTSLGWDYVTIEEIEIAE